MAMHLFEIWLERCNKISPPLDTVPRGVNVISVGVELLLLGVQEKLLESRLS